MLDRTLCAAAAALFLAVTPAQAAGLAMELGGIQQITAPADYVGSRDALVHDSALSDEDLQVAAQNPDWKVRLQAQAVLAWRVDPDRAAAAWEAQPMVTRAQFYRFTTTEMTDAAIMPILMERLLHKDEHPEVRAALIEVMGRSAGDWPEAAAELATSESDGLVRQAATFVLRRAPAEVAMPALAEAMTDSVADVRAEAARSAGWHAEGQLLGSQLIPLLQDGDDEVRAMAARSTGWKGVDAAVGPLGALLDDPSADVRLNALRSIDRIDSAAAKALTELPTLTNDSDARVARLAAKISQ